MGTKLTPLYDMLAALRHQGAVLNPPAPPALISELEKAVHHPLPPEVRALYEDHNGQPHCLDAGGEDTGQISRLMPIEELLETLRDIADEYPDLDDVARQFLPLWEDVSGGDHDVLFLEEPFRDRVAFSSHELGGLVLRPTFRNIAAYYAVTICRMVHRRDDLQWPLRFQSYLLQDYPAARPHPETDSEDEIAFRHCLERYAAATDEIRREYYGFNAVYLCPYLRTDEILPLLDDDALVSEVCSVLHRRNWPGAVPALGRTVLRQGSYSGLAIDILAEISDPSAEQELLQLSSELYSDVSNDVKFIAEALQRRGFEVRKTEEAKYVNYRRVSPDRYQFRRRGETAWQDLGGQESNGIPS